MASAFGRGVRKEVGIERRTAETAVLQKMTKRKKEVAEKLSYVMFQHVFFLLSVLEQFTEGYVTRLVVLSLICFSR